MSEINWDNYKPAMSGCSPCECVDSLIEIGKQLQAELESSTVAAMKTMAQCGRENKQLQAENKDIKTALNMEESPRGFAPKIPYKWKYEEQAKRTKKAGQYIKQLQAELDKEKGLLKRWLARNENLADENKQLQAEIKQLKADLETEIKAHPFGGDE